MKVLVTGGAGYIGSHAVYLLIKKGYQVVIIDNLKKGFESNIHPEAKFYNVDICNKDEVEKVFIQEKNIKAIMHFAGLIVVPESTKQPLEYFNVNTNGVWNILSIAKDFNVETFIFSSTAAVYGEVKKSPIFEDDPKNPINPYGQSKLAAEFLIQSWAKAFERNYVIFRYFNVAGSDESGKIGVKGKSLTHLVPLVINAAINLDKTFYIFGNQYETKDGTCIRDFVHVNDLVNAHILGMEWSLKNKKSDIFNLGTGKGYSVKEVLDITQQELNISIKFEIASPRPGDPSKLYSDISKVQSILKWEPKYKLRDIILSEYNFRKKYNN